MGRLDGKIALITGGTTGIGEATAHLFRDEGATVIVTGTNATNLAQANSEPGIEAVKCDQSSMADLDALMAGIKERHGRLDVVFVNAGITGASKRIEDVDEDEYDRVMGINLKGVYFTVQKALPLMPDGSAIILTASVGAHRGMVGSTVYCATKAGVAALTRGFAAELVERNIRINTLTPGLFETPLFDKLDAPKDMVMAHLSSLVPMKRAGQPSEAATAALFLASSDSSFITGTELAVSGGQLFV